MLKFKFNWVLVNEIAISSAPFELPNIYKIKEEGIKSILSLCSEKEVKLARGIDKEFICRRLILPDHTYEKKLEINDINQALIILEELTKKGPVLVHCYAAIERSPLICMAWLMKKNNLDLESALSYMSQVNPGTNPLPNQLKLLNQLNHQDI